MENDILAKLSDLHRQATQDRSHYYTGSVISEAILEIQALRETIRKLLEQKL
ncbi:MAG: hypothetical protein ACRDHW_24010 [Ktedonobacteraceae bacterium]